jgi:hypothetical protein
VVVSVRVLLVGVLGASGVEVGREEAEVDPSLLSSEPKEKLPEVEDFDEDKGAENESLGPLLNLLTMV